MYMTRRLAAATALIAVDLGLLVFDRPHWARVARQLAALRPDAGPTTPDTAVAAVAAAGLWLVAAWIGLGVAAQLLSCLPGLAGRVAEAASRRLLPALVRRLVAGSAGLGVLLAPVAAGAAPVDPQLDHPAAVAALPTPVWPVTGDPQPPTEPRHSAPPSAPTPVVRGASGAPPNRPPDRAPDGDTVRVRPGDSLWLIAARRLGPSADAVQVAAAWRRWYAANRTIIGRDPALILPGQVLSPPTRSSGAQS